MQFINYKTCSTCQKARKHLDRMNISYIDRPILEKVSIEELKQWIPLSNQELKKFFNTSGKVYRENKDKIQLMSDEEKIIALSENGMLVKRPLLVGDDFVLVGYNEKEYDEIGEKYGKK